MRTIRLWSLVFGIVLWGSACKTEGASPTPAEPQQPVTPTPSGPTITLDPSTVYQTMGGWMVPVNQTVRDYYKVAPLLGRMYELGVGDLGLSRISVEVFPGVENRSADCQQAYLDGVSTEGDYLTNCAYNPVNDNGNPDVANPAGFHFQILDWQIDNQVLPMRRQMEARGESLYVNVRLIDFRLSSFEQNQDPAEYAELVLAIFDHIKSKYGFVPDGFDLINEPDNSAGWRDGALVGRLAAAAGQRLARAGYHPDLSGPSTMDKGKAVPYFDAMLAQSGASQYVKELSWHCYDDSGQNTAAQIAARAVSAKVRVVQNECWGSSNTYAAMHQDIKNSRTAVWSMGLIHGTNGYYAVADDGTVTLRDRAKYMRQYYKYIRNGARRIGATSSADALDPLAFINTDGRYVVVVKAQGDSQLTITNLPAGTYGIYSTTGPDPSSVSAFDVTATDQTIAANGRLTTSIRGSGVITIYQKPASSASLADGATNAVDAAVVPADAAAVSAAAVAPLAQSYVTRDGVHLTLRWLSDASRQPVDVAVTPDQRTFVAEKSRVSVVRDGTVLSAPALLLPADAADGPEELQALSIAGSFPSDRFVYTLSTTGSAQRSFRVSRFVEAGDRLLNRVVLMEGIPASATPAGSLRFGPDGALYVAFDQGLARESVGDAASYNGKIIRLNADGTTPRSNRLGSPIFAGGSAWPRGLGWQSATGAMWLAGQDEGGLVDVLDGTAGVGSRLARFLLPPDILPGALAVYHSDREPRLTENILVGSASTGELMRLVPHPGNWLTPPVGERLLSGDVGGIHALAVSADGLIYVGSDRGLGLLVPAP